jgi:hypothetical protein
MIEILEGLRILWHYWEVGHNWRSRLLGVCPRKTCVVPSPFLSFCFLAAMRWASLLHHKLPTMILSFPTGPEGEKPSNHGPKPLKQWAKLNFPSLLLVFLGDFYKVEMYLFIIVLSLLHKGNSFILFFSVCVCHHYNRLWNIKEFPQNNEKLYHIKLVYSIQNGWRELKMFNLWVNTKYIFMI